MTTVFRDSSDIAIIPLRAEHAAALHRLEAGCFSAPWSEASIAALADDPRAASFAALYKGEPVGYVSMYYVLDAGMINNIATAPEMRRRGIATALLRALADRCEKLGVRELTLEVRQSNRAAVSLYEKEGFVFVGVRRNYYDSPREDALLYKKEIKCSTLQ